ncbi:MAG: Hint domain-containing protein [Methylocystis sp.]|uniref:Hint domain-containing protein n=1 Tax=Methylocystis sp. TaxID=1911079 RepID=UPI003DA6A8BA
MNPKIDARTGLAEEAAQDRRRFLAIAGRNALAIGALGASATLARVERAAAYVPGCDFGSFEVPGHNPNCGTTPSTSNCFLKGTRILTVDGERNVEDLSIGDLLPTAFGGVRPIQWIGHHRYRRSNPEKAWVEDVRPVRIGRGAIAEGVPHRDLWVTGGHALLFDGMLVRARQLVNGKTIVSDAAEGVDELEYFHIKLETHDVIFAEGVACESLLDVSETFNNFADYLRLYGAPEANPQTCAPVLYNGARAEIRERLRVLAAPWRGPCRIDVIRDRLDARASALDDELARS